MRLSLNAVLVCLLMFLLTACPNSTPAENNPSNPDSPSLNLTNQVAYKGVKYELSNGLIRPKGLKEGTHTATRLSVADGTYYPTLVYYGTIPVTVMRVAAGEAEIDITLYTLGSAFTAGTYTYAAPVSSETGPTPGAQNHFNAGEISIDTNGSGDIDDGETFDITGGTITVEALSEGMRLIYNLELADGSSVTASYERPVWDPKKPETTYPGPSPSPDPDPPPIESPSSSSISVTVRAPSGGDIIDTIVNLCFIGPDGCDSDSPNTKAVRVASSGEAASVEFKDLAAGRYILVGVKDVDGSGALDAGDYLGCYGPSNDTCTRIEPGASDLDMQMLIYSPSLIDYDSSLYALDLNP